MRNQIVDRQLVPVGTAVRHLEFVDNFVALGCDEGEVRSAAEAVNKQLGKAGLPTHGCDVTVGGEALGWEFSESRPLVRPTPCRIWKLRLGCLGAPPPRSSQK